MTSEVKHAYTVREAAELTGFSRQTITRLFEKEKSVLILERREALHKRSYQSMRNPAHVFQRVVRRLGAERTRN